MTASLVFYSFLKCATMCCLTFSILCPIVDQLLTLDLDGSLYTVLQQHFSLFPAEAIQEFEAMPASSYEYDLLHVHEGAPVLKRQRTTFDNQGHPFEYVKSVYRGDRYRFVAKLLREGVG